LNSVPGVGDGVTFTLLGEPPELGQLSPRKMVTILNAMVRDDCEWQAN